VLLSKQVIMLVLIAATIAVPTSWIVMKGWLNNFAHRIDFSLWMFAFGTLAAFVIALLTVSYQALKAANANPITSLKYE